MQKNQIKPGMVFQSESHPEIQYVVIALYDDYVCLERITCREAGCSNRHSVGYGWFEHTYTKAVRIMGKRELSVYLEGTGSGNSKEEVSLAREVIQILESAIDNIRIKNEDPISELEKLAACYEQKSGFYSILSTSKEDFWMEGFDPDNLDVSTMRGLACHFSNIEPLMDSYWEALRYIAGEYLGLPRL